MDVFRGQLLYHISDVPEAPGQPEIVNTTGNSVTIVWSRPENDGGSEITAYHVEKRQKQAHLWTRYVEKNCH